MSIGLSPQPLLACRSSITTNQPSPPGQPLSQQLPTTSTFPTTLPTFTIPMAELKPRYSLSSVAAHLVDRDRVVIQEQTWEDIRKDILKYLGFLYLYASTKVCEAGLAG